MRRKILVLTILLLGAFFLLSPQISQAAISCKCTVAPDVGTKTPGRFGCVELHPATLGQHFTNCEQFKTALVTYDSTDTEGKNNHASAVNAVLVGSPFNTADTDSLTANGVTCAQFTDEKCQTPFVAPVTPVQALKAELTARKPVLEVNIPGLNFDDVKERTDGTGTYFYLPWIPQLISALYKFGLAIVSIVAAVIIIIQGLRVITSGGGEGKTVAYKKILQCIIGLFIAWGSYALLYTINPALVQFNALKVKVVEPKTLAAALHMQTSGDTAVVGGVGGSAPTAQAFSGTYTPKFTTCPITLDAPYDAASLQINSVRVKEFYTKIVTSPQVTGAVGSAERVLQIADAAIVCNIGLGSCGRTVGQIYSLAGINYKATNCLLSAYGCGPWEKENRYISPATIITNPKITQKDGASTPIAEVLKLIRDSNVAPGWPDEWAKELRPGDAIWFYNGNGSGGNHTAMFVGWKGGSYEASGGWAETINGGMFNRLTGRANWCITNQCGDKMMPIIKTLRPTQTGR